MTYIATATFWNKVLKPVYFTHGSSQKKKLKEEKFFPFKKI